MKQSASVTKLVQVLSWFSALILVLVPFHAFLTVWLSSLLGHYTLLRLWKEFLLLLIVMGGLYVLLTDQKLLRRFFKSKFIWLILAYILLLIISALVALGRHSVSQKAMAYGILVDSRYSVFFLSTLVLAAKSDWLHRSWLKLMIGPAVLVAAFAVLQYLVLPTDFLKHFGYGPSTISPYETINHNINYIRVASTLRGANPLGAYLVLPICALTALLVKERPRRRDKTIIMAGLLAALAFSFSRSAWLGTLLGILVVAWLSITSAKLKNIAWWALGVVVVTTAVATLVLRNNHTFQDVFLHTDSASQVAQSSNQGHSAAFKSAVKDIIHQPLGGGVGSAGPQSVYNRKPARIAENYYLQIGQEAGLLGMVLFIAIIISLGWILYGQRNDLLALALLASLVGLCLVNFLSHAWEDDTLAYVWWGLAGIACAPAILKARIKNGQARLSKT